MFHRVAWPAARWNNEVGNAKHIEFCAANLRKNLLPKVQKCLNIASKLSIHVLEDPS